MPIERWGAPSSSARSSNASNNRLLVPPDGAGDQFRVDLDRPRLDGRRHASDGQLDLPNEREKADERLKFGLEWLAELGVPVTGEVITDADTVAAVCRVVNERAIDEVIISTLPTTLSRSLRQDLPHRIERKVAVPVTVVTSKSSS